MAGYEPVYGPVPYAAPTYAAPAKAYAPEPYYPPEPYSFGYDINDGYGGALNQQETGDAHGNKKGSYGYKDAYGIYRQVDYVADDYGFRATIKTNEPGTANQDPASVQLQSSAPPVQYAPAPYKAPSYSAPTYVEPVYSAPRAVYSAPAPVYKAPVYAAPVVKAPLYRASYNPVAAAYSIPSISYAKGY